MKTANQYPGIEKHFVEIAGELAESFSINRIVAQLYALLYISPEAVSLEEMAEKLMISKGSVSINIRILEDWNAVKRVWVQGSRKDYYTADADIYKIICQRMEQGLSRRFDLTQNKMDDLCAQLNQKDGKKPDAKNNFYRERLKKIEELQNLSKVLLKFLPKLRSLKNLKGLISLLR